MTERPVLGLILYLVPTISLLSLLVSRDLWDCPTGRWSLRGEKPRAFLPSQPCRSSSLTWPCPSILLWQQFLSLSL